MPFWQSGGAFSEALVLQRLVSGETAHPGNAKPTKTAVPDGLPWLSPGLALGSSSVSPKMEDAKHCRTVTCVTFAVSFKTGAVVLGGQEEWWKKRTLPTELTRPGGHPSRPHQTIPCWAARQQSPTPFHQAPSMVVVSETLEHVPSQPKRLRSLACRRHNFAPLPERMAIPQDYSLLVRGCSSIP